MKPRLTFILLLTLLSIASLLVVGVVYFYLPREEVVTRQLLFGVTFQIWGILATILFVRKMLEIRDTQRWEAINKYVFAFLYLKIWEVLGKVFEIFKVKIEVKESQVIKKFGVEYLNPEHTREWKQKVKQELEQTVNEGLEVIKTNMKSWKPSTHKVFSEIMRDFKDKINELLESYPHLIPPEFLSVIVDVRERAHGLSNQSEMLSEREFFEKQGADYEKFHASIIELESSHVSDLFSKLLKLLDILEKNVGPEWK